MNKPHEPASATNAALLRAQAGQQQRLADIERLLGEDL